MHDKLNFIDDLEQIYNVFDKNTDNTQIFVAKRLILEKIHRFKKEIEAFETANAPDPIPKQYSRRRM